MGAPANYFLLCFLPRLRPRFAIASASLSLSDSRRTPSGQLGFGIAPGTPPSQTLMPQSNSVVKYFCRKTSRRYIRSPIIGPETESRRRIAKKLSDEKLRLIAAFW
jgi:hypothetical protein